MAKEQKEEIAKLLNKSNSFSKSDDDLGRTGIVQHKSENAHPIKQPLRQTPVLFNSDVDRQIYDA